MLTRLSFSTTLTTLSNSKLYNGTQHKELWQNALLQTNYWSLLEPRKS